MFVSLTLVRYRNIFVPLALVAMAVHRLPLALNRKCSFWKLMGSGKNGTFDLNPDWNQWALLAVWQRREDFETFRTGSFISKWWRLLTTEQWTILCEPLSSHGKWDGKEPFGTSFSRAEHPGTVAVLTRASIRRKHLKSFWRNVDPVAMIMRSAPGYIFSTGVGEAPVYRQATFSVWENQEQLKAFAYGSPEHREVILKTRKEGWYSEELFARFKPLATFGSLDGRDPLAGKIQPDL